MYHMFASPDPNCFLAEKKWRKVARDNGRLLGQSALGTPLDWILLTDDYLTNLSDVPPIVRYGYLLREANRHGIPVDPVKTKALAEVTAARREAFIEWYWRYTDLCASPTEVPSKDPDSIYETVLEFRNPWAATFCMGYWATMLILQETLNQCKYEMDYSDNNRELMRNILRSLETVGKGLMGPYRVGYAVRIASEFADTKTQAWIITTLDRMSKDYAAVGTDTYPKGPNEYEYS
jgi:hypothetical protein